MLFDYDRLEGLVEPFTERMDGASTIGADGAGADGSLVDFYCQVEVTKRIQGILLGLVLNVVRC